MRDALLSLVINQRLHEDGWYGSGGIESRTRGSGDEPRPGKAIVVAEEEDLRYVVSEALTAAGFTVLNAEPGPEALCILEASPSFDLLFTDNVTPGGINGFELAQRAKQLASGPPNRVHERVC